MSKGVVDNFKLIREFMEFDSEDQFYFLQILQRKKDGPGTNGTVSGTNNKARAIKSYCVTSKEMLGRIELEVKHLCEYFNARAYFYPARRSFQKVALKTMVDLANNIASGNFSHAKTDYWSACGQTSIEKFYLVDVDENHYNPEDLVKIRTCIEEEVNSGMNFGRRIRLKVPTKHGIHFICYPFDVKVFSDKWPDIDVHKSNPTVLFCTLDV